LSYSIYDVLNFFWNNIRPEEFRESKMDRDWAILTDYFPVLDTSYKVTLERLGGDDDRFRKKKLIMLILKLYTLRDRSIKAVCHGPNSNDLRTSVSSLIGNSTYPGMIMDVSETTPISFYKKFDYDKLFWLHNYSILSMHSETKINLFNIWQSSKLAGDEVSNNELFDSFIQDPSININVKKRILMLALSFGLINDVETWTERTDTIVHYWIKPQKFNSTTGKYYGSFIIIAILGNKKLKLSYDENGGFYTVYCSDILNYEKTYTLLSHLVTIVGVTIEDVFRTLPNGDWILADNRIAPLEGHGKEIIQHNFYDYEPPTGFSISSMDDWTYLVDENGRHVYKVSTGLLDSTRFPEEENLPNFEVFGLSIFDISKLGCFTSGFNIMYKRQSETLFALKDLEVKRQKISDVTKARLKLSQTWETYEGKVECDLGMTDVNIIDTEDLKDVGDPMDDFVKILEEKDDTFSDELKKAVFTIEDDVSYLKDFIDKFNLTGLFNTYQSSQKVMRTRLNWNKIKRMKSTIIAHQCLKDLRINKKIILEIYRMTRNEDLLSSLIMFYDVIYTNTEAESPKDLSMNINGEFIEKFNLLDDSDSELH
jgi:hypothetical protein